MNEMKRIRKWIKDHKVELVVAGVVTVVGTVLVIKNWDSLKKLFKESDIVIPSDVTIIPVIEKQETQTIPSAILNNLTGTKMTATQLGNKVLCSPQAINKRIVEAELAIKLPCGEYQLTEAGKLVGKAIWKVTAAGHSFSNIEWDEKILELLFSAEELFDIEKRKAYIEEVLGDFVA